MTILLLVLFLGLLIWVSHLSSTIRQLETRLDGLTSPKISPQKSVQEQIIYQEPAPIVTAAVNPFENPTDHNTEMIDRTDFISSFENWLKSDWQIKLGAFLLLISFGWFARYAFMHNWIGPVGRISLGIITGCLITAIGTYRLKTIRTQGEIFLVLGSSIVLITVFAAQYYYQMFSPYLALTLMFLASAYVAFISAKEKNVLLAFTGLILGGIAPQLTATPGLNPMELFTYLLAITLGSIWLAFLHKRRSVVAAGLGVYTFYTLIYTNSDLVARPETSLLALFSVFALVFAAANITNFIKTTTNEYTSDFIVALLNNILLTSWIYLLAPESWRISLMLVWALLFTGASFICRAFGTTKALWTVYFGTAITLLAIATALQFNGDALVVAFTLETLAVIATTYFMTKDFAITRRMSFLLIIPILLSLPTITSYKWSGEDVLPLVITLSIIAASCLVLGFVFRYVSDETEEASVTITALFATGIGYLFIILERLLNGEALIAAYTLLAIVIIATTHIVHNTLKTTVRLSWLLIIPATLSTSTIFSQQWQRGEILPLVSTLGLLAATCFGLSFAFKAIADSALDETERLITNTLTIVGSVYLYTIIWRVFHVVLPVDIATMSSLIIYTVVGLTTNIYGQLHQRPTLRVYGGILLGLVVARLLMIDIWQMDIPGRIVTFFLIGTLLMSTAFLGKTKMHLK